MSDRCSTWMISIGSLFSGIGGLELGLERATGGRVVWQAETDEHCRQVLAKHWPGVHRYKDVRDVGKTAERPTIICGGFPCQDISNAGKREGIEGARSGLWAEFSRIVRELRPEIVFVENVRALANRGLDRVLGDLAGLGYDAQWDCLGACCVGAPHRRARLFLLAYPQGGIPDAVRDALRFQRQRDGQQRGESRTPVAGDDGAAGALADTAGERWEVRAGSAAGRQDAGAAVARPGRPLVGEQRDEWWKTEPDVGRVVDGLSGHVDGGGATRSVRLRALGHAVVPQQAAAAWEILADRARLTHSSQEPVEQVLERGTPG